MTTDDFTDAARVEAERKCTINPSTSPGERIWNTRHMHDFGVHMAEWARTHLAAQEPTDAEVEAAEVEWEHHQPYKRFRMWWCHCGAPGKWGSLEAHRQHALWHVLRAARRDEEKRASCGCDLTGLTPPAVHLVDDHEGAKQRLSAQEPTDAERAVRELHRPYRVYEFEDACPDTSDGHREAHHHEDSDGYGEFYCDQRPLYTLCDHCRDESGERVDRPCATIQALDMARANRRDEEKR